MHLRRPQCSFARRSGPQRTRIRKSDSRSRRLRLLSSVGRRKLRIGMQHLNRATTPMIWDHSKFDLNWFLQGGRMSENGLRYASLFSGGGVGDLGFVRSGWTCIAACEKDFLRRETFRANIPNCKIFEDVTADAEDFIDYVKSLASELDLLVATPPCQSFSTANAKRGKHADADAAEKDIRNSLFFHALKVANELEPKLFVIENVPNFFTRKVRSSDGKMTAKVGDFLDASLPKYHGFQTVICFSAFGIPQRRKRALAVYIRKDVFDSADVWRKGLHPMLPHSWPEEYRRPGPSALEALSGFLPLDGKTPALAEDPDDPLHKVPTYDPVRYSWISNIPPNSGRSAYENDICPSCQNVGIPGWIALCPLCGSPLTHRPHVVDQDDGFRLIKGFKTSYRRMRSDVPASTVTTASSHFGSDLKLHPTQNRVLSMRECAYLQTVPNDFDWSAPLNAKRRKTYALRQIIGEAVPSWFAFKLGSALSASLRALNHEESPSVRELLLDYC